jgi:hypothetical protein
LLPKLLPLGRPRAHLLLGIIWGLWHLPLVLVGFTYPGHPVVGTAMFIFLTVGFGTYLDELTLKHRSSVLAGWAHGVFNSQKLGVWPLLFPDVNPLLGGYAGLLGIGIWLLLGARETPRLRRPLARRAGRPSSRGTRGKERRRPRGTAHLVAVPERADRGQHLPASGIGLGDEEMECAAIARIRSRGALFSPLPSARLPTSPIPVSWEVDSGSPGQIADYAAKWIGWVRYGVSWERFHRS